MDFTLGLFRSASGKRRLRRFHSEHSLTYLGISAQERIVTFLAPERDLMGDRSFPVPLQILRHLHELGAFPVENVLFCMQPLPERLHLLFLTRETREAVDDFNLVPIQS
jgi:hypothetical protein